MAALENSLSKKTSKCSFTHVNCAFSVIFSSISHRSPILRRQLNSRWREMAALDISLSKMASKCSFTHVNCAFSNIFSSIYHRSPIWRQRLNSSSQSANVWSEIQSTCNSRLRVLLKHFSDSSKKNQNCYSIFRLMVLLSSARASGGIGRRAGFRFQYREVWGFKSLLAHHTK